MSDIPGLVRAVARSAREAFDEGMFVPAVHITHGDKVMILDLSGVDDEDIFDCAALAATNFGFEELLLLRQAKTKAGTFLTIHWEFHGTLCLPRLWAARITDGVAGKWCEAPAINGVRSILGEQRESLSAN